MARAKQPVSINGIEFDALIDEDLTFESDIPSYPVERGFEVSDGIIIKPKKLSMTLFVGLSVTWASRFNRNPMRYREVEQRFRELYLKKRPVRIITSENRYESMGIKTISFKKYLEIGYAREFAIEFQEIRVTESQTAIIPAYYGETGLNAGTANTTISETPPGQEVAATESADRASILWSLFRGAGIMNSDGSFNDIGNVVGGWFGG